MKIFFLFTVIFLATAVGFPAPGDLDTTFSHDGRLLADRGYRCDYFNKSVAVQPDGKIVVGYMRSTDPYPYASCVLVLARYNPNGTPDLTFENDGEVITPFIINTSNNSGADIAIQPNGKILAALTGDYEAGGIVRYNSNGSLDTSFGYRSLGSAYSVSLTIQPDGKIIATTEYYLIRLNSNGSIDAAFGGGTGMVRLPTGTYGTKSVIQEDGKIVTGCYQGCSLIRHNVDGTLDTGFGSGGIVIPPPNFHFYSVVIQSDGKIVAAGGAEAGFAVCRYTMDGSPDLTFGGGDGIVTTRISTGYDDATGIAVQPDGKILASGYSDRYGTNDDFALARYNTDGSLDTTFGGGDGTATVDFNNSSDTAGGIALDGSSRAFLAGTADSTAGIACFVLDNSDHRPYHVDLDFDGDGHSDISVFRPSDSTWYLDRSTDGFYAVQFGLPTDRITPADFDGDGKTDIAVYRPSSGTWYWLNSSDGTAHGVQFGSSEDLPTPADYDDDNKADVSVFRPSTGTWYRQNSSDGSFFAMPFGSNGDRPALGDYDGDSKADIAVFRPSSDTWYWINSSDGSTRGEQFGSADDLIVPGDYDGDGKTDLAVFRPSNGYWYIHKSESSEYAEYNFGLDGDIPAAADFDGDGRTDISVFRPSDGNWYRVSSQDRSFVADHFGTAGDMPIQAAFGY